ncbi:MAG: ribonuclease domain-containing protein [Nocardioides sp.]
MVFRVPPPEDSSAPRPGRSTGAAVVVVLALALALGIWLINGRTAGPPTSAEDQTGAASTSPSTSPEPSSALPPEPGQAGPGTRPPGAPTSEASGSGTPAAAVDPDSGLPTVYLLDLPPEAAETVQMIDDGPPYLYDKDGSTFGNYEGLLPDRERGYYQEFTVETPGSYDRGARRIVEGADAELYWTDDHYESFSRIVL